MNADAWKKRLLLHLPYGVIGLAAAKLSEAWRLSAGTDFSAKFLHLRDGAAMAFQPPFSIFITAKEISWSNRRLPPLPGLSFVQPFSYDDPPQDVRTVKTQGIYQIIGERYGPYLFSHICFHLFIFQTVSKCIIVLMS